MFLKGNPFGKENKKTQQPMYVIVQKNVKEENENISETQSWVSWPERQRVDSSWRVWDPLRCTQTIPHQPNSMLPGPHVNPTPPFFFPIFW